MRAHERSLNIDLPARLPETLLPRRPDLKADPVFPRPWKPTAFPLTSMARPVLEVSGRTYPVEMRYRTTERAADRSAGKAAGKATSAKLDAGATAKG